MSSSRLRARQAASFLLPALVLVLAYRPIWDVWFRADDFAWLGLRLPVHNFSTLLTALFQPMAQGTVRFLSERAFFLLFSTWFGNDPEPMRIVVFLIQLANIALLGRLAWRLSGSYLTAGLAPVLWILNPGTFVSMTWLSTWNQLLVVFFLLAALLSFIERRKWLCWISFLLGFGALEINIMFPVLVAAYVWFYQRDRLREVWPFAIPTLLFVGIHLWVIPKNRQDPTYQFFWGLDIPRRLFRYWKWGLGFWRYVELVGAPVIWERLGSPILTVVGAASLGWGAWNYVRQRVDGRLALFGLVWFVALLLPVLPLRNHFSDYYLASASVGMALILATALSEALRHQKYLAPLVALPLAALGFACWQVGATTVGWYSSHSQATEQMVRGVVEARRLHPNDVILLENVDNSLFWDGVMDDPFRLYLVFDVYLTPGSEGRLSRSIAGDDFTPFVFPEEDTRFLLDREAIQVYRVGNGPLRNITRAYQMEQASAPVPGLPRFIDLSKTAYADLLGAGWHEIANRARWAGAVAEVRMGAPKSESQALWLNGFLPAAVVREGPQVLTVTANGQKLPPVTLSQADAPVAQAIPLPKSLVGAPEMSLRLEFSRVHRERNREHSLILRQIAIR